MWGGNRREAAKQDKPLPVPFTILKRNRPHPCTFPCRDNRLGRTMNAVKNMAWIALAAALLALVVLSRDWSYAKKVVGALDGPAQMESRS